MNSEGKRDGWSPYLAGSLAGLLAVASVLASTALLGNPKYLGASTTFVRAVGLVERSVAPEHVANNAYYQAKRVRVDWQMLFVVGILFGALASSKGDRSFRGERVPPIWSDRFGPSVRRRAMGAFLGGVVAMFGARLAGGCPSGHGLSGLMQLSVSGYIAMTAFFGAGVFAAHLLYRRGGAQ